MWRSRGYWRTAESEAGYMKILLVPWLKSYPIALRIYRGGEGRIHFSDYIAQIATARGQRIALALIQRHAESIRLSASDFLSDARMVVEAEIPDPVGGRLLLALKLLGHIAASRLIPKELAENPSLEDLERFLSIRKLLE
ncbi:MAG: hypothetical protein QXX87_05500 [Candidatus Jordarchaeales archaeon]